MKTSGSMTAVLKPRAAPGLEVARVEIPALGPHDVLIKVQAASICGTDLHIYKWDKWAASRIRTPLVFGHEFCGEVVAIGELVSRVAPAAFVSVEGHIPDGTCFQCRTGNSHICENLQIVGIDRPGCFAEYVAVPEQNVYALDRSIPLEVAAILDPFGNAVHTTLAGASPRSPWPCVGAGPIGCCAVAVARAAGAQLHRRDRRAPIPPAARAPHGRRHRHRLDAATTRSRWSAAPPPAAAPTWCSR